QDGDVLQTGPAHLRARELGRLLDLLLVRAVGADALDGDEVGEVLYEPDVVLREPVEHGLHDGSPRGDVSSECMRSECEVKEDGRGCGFPPSHEHWWIRSLPKILANSCLTSPPGKHYSFHHTATKRAPSDGRKVRPVHFVGSKQRRRTTFPCGNPSFPHGWFSAS